MATTTGQRKARATREADVTKQSRAFTEAADAAVAESQRFVRAWAAAYSASVRGWADVMRVSAETAGNAAKAFDEALRERT